MSLIDRRLGVAYEADELGLVCAPAGVSLAGAPLLEKTVRGLVPRPSDEIGKLATAAYGPGFDAHRLRAGLGVVSDALNRGDIGRALVAAMHMRLPTLTRADAERVARAEGAIAKYSPDQPRDWRGRWTDGDGGDRNAVPELSPSPGARGDATITGQDQGPRARLELPLAPPVRPPLPEAVAIVGLWARPRLYQGGNAPPEDDPPPVDIEPARPVIDPLNTSVGWDVPGQVINGIYYPPTRNPTFANGEPWPRATAPEIRRILDPGRGRLRSMKIFVPVDGIGPTLIGSNRSEDFQRPNGYIEVEFSGNPQENIGGRGATTHADRSVEEALILARTGRFSMILFNRTMSTVTGRVVQSNLRPDVYGVLLPNFRTPMESIGHPLEVMSGRQNSGYKDADYAELGVHLVTYKILMKILLSEWSRRHVCR